MHAIIAQWRQQAEHAPAAVAHSLLCCADELEQAWHDHAHDGVWYPENCQICVKEMAEQ